MPTPRQSNSPTTSSTFMTPITSPSSLKRVMSSPLSLLLRHIQYAPPHYMTSPSHTQPLYLPHTISNSNPTTIFPFPIFHIWIIGAVTIYSMNSNPIPSIPSSIPTDRTTQPPPAPADSRNCLPSTQQPHYHHFCPASQGILPSRILMHHHLPSLSSTYNPPSTDHLRHRLLEYFPHSKHPPSPLLSRLHH